MAVGLYDVGTRKEAFVSEEEAAKGIRAGTLSPGKTTTYNMVKPDGNATGVPGTDVHLALANGWRFETAKEKKVNDYLQDNQGVAGSLKAAGSAAVREASFGVIDPSRGDEQMEALEAANPIATGIGTAAGIGGSLLYGGGAFKAAAKAGKVAEGALFAERSAEAIGLGQRIARAAVRTGAESAALAAPRVVSEATMGDPEEAAETLLWSLGAGAALGAVGSAFAAGAERTASAAGKGFKALTGEELSGPGLGKLVQQRVATAEGRVADQAKESLSLSDVLLGKTTHETLTNALMVTGHPLLYGAKVGKDLLMKTKGEELIAKYGNQLGLALTDGALDTAAQRLSGVGSALRKATLAGTSATKPRDVFGAFLGDEPKDDRTGFEQVAQRLVQMSADPVTLAESGPGKLIRDGAPQTAAAYAAASSRALNYLVEVLPRPLVEHDVLSDQKWKPSKAEVSRFAKQLQVVVDPMVVMQKLADGTLSMDEVHALDAVYPKLGLRLRNELALAVGDDKVRSALRSTRKAKVRLLLGPGTSPGPSNVADFQQIYAKQNGGKQFGQGRKINVSKLPGAQPTTIDRLSAGM